MARPIFRSLIAVSFLLLTYTGSSAQSGATGPAEEPATLVTPTGTIYGTLLLPNKSQPPVVLIIAGSGPTDRNGNSPLLPGANNSLKMLAEELAANGIASLRYDKRGIAASAKAMKAETDIRFTDYVVDAAAWAKQLRADKRFSTLVIAGHSEGSLIGMIASQGDVDGYVSISGSGRRAGDVLIEQLRPKLPPDLMTKTEAIVADINAGKIPDGVPAELNTLFRPSVLPYMLSWLRFDPAQEIAKLKIPVLIAQGTTDIQVTVGDAKLLSKADAAATLVIIDGMNHVLKMVPDDPQKQAASYSDPTLQIAPELVTEIVKFVKKAKRNKV